MRTCGVNAHRYDAAMPNHVDPRFRRTNKGRFAERLGPQGPGVAHSEKKLCVVATDLSLLCDLLFGLSLRHDCYYVKYGLVEREGMCLGRIEQAFGRPDEAAMVAAVRATKMAYISLVAGKKPDVEGGGWPLVGHVMLSPVTVDGSTDSRGIGVAPVAVIPSEQRKGYGAELVRAGLRRARLLGYRFAVVLGHAGYYPRFGCVPASRFGLSYGADVPDADFMAVELVPGALEPVRGIVRYHAAFDD
jgi:putative acetyltransferase